MASFPRPIWTAAAGAALVAWMCAALSSCGGKPAAPPAAGGGAKAESKAEPKAEAKAETKGEAGAGGAFCRTIDIGDHKYLGDLDFDPATGTVTLVVMDHATGAPYPHPKVDAVLNLVLGSGTAQVKMPPAPQDGDPEGSTSRYQVADPSLKGLKDLKGRVNLKVDDQTFVCDLAAAH